MSLKILPPLVDQEKKVRYENRLPLQKCKDLLIEKAKAYTDDQVLQIRDFLYQLAELDYQLFYKATNQPTNIPLNPVQNNDTTESNYLLPGEYRRAG
ncbi:MAG: hypothetical protein ABI378_01765 [Chitinophagaceae bacterium]